MTCGTGPVDLDGLEVIGMDEFAIHKGHRYATVIVEPTRKRVLWVGRGPMDSATTPTSSSRSALPSPELGEEPKKSPHSLSAMGVK